jgi:hypothetical protein
MVGGDPWGHCMTWKPPEEAWDDCLDRRAKEEREKAAKKAATAAPAAVAAPAPARAPLLPSTPPPPDLSTMWKPPPYMAADPETNQTAAAAAAAAAVKARGGFDFVAAAAPRVAEPVEVGEMTVATWLEQKGLIKLAQTLADAGYIKLDQLTDPKPETDEYNEIITTAKSFGSKPLLRRFIRELKTLHSDVDELNLLNTKELLSLMNDSPLGLKKGATTLSDKQMRKMLLPYIN